MPCLVALNLLEFKGYIRQKTITSQNVQSKAQIKNILEKLCSVQDIQSFLFLTIP